MSWKTCGPNGSGKMLGIAQKRPRPRSRRSRTFGSDGSTESNLEGGQVYRCRADGSRVELVAFGFWNPFHLTLDTFGRLFAVDNDPDSRPPCRLLHIVEGGDYGYRYRNGRKGVHPFTAWNGELPGTLPMVAGTGEAPCAVVAYESDNLPEEYRGDLLVTSWGDHRIERYKLKPRGASFSAEMQPVVRGGERLRQAVERIAGWRRRGAPDGSHRRLRLWRGLYGRQPGGELRLDFLDGSGTQMAFAGEAGIIVSLHVRRASRGNRRDKHPSDPLAYLGAH